MAKYRIVRVGRGRVPEVDEEQRRLGPLGAEVVGVDAASEDQLVEALKGADGVLNYGGRFPASVIQRLDSVWIIVQASTGYDLIDDEAATTNGIMVANLPFQCLHEVANSALAYILTLNRRLVPADRQVKAGGWDRFIFMPIGTIFGETLGLLGFGNISRAVAKRGQALDMNVIAYDPYVDPAIAKEMNVELVSLDDVFRRSDYISCHLPHNRHTDKMLSTAQFDLMKPSAFFVNTARGKVVDEPALIKALQDGKIAGAGLDVFEVEPLPDDSPLKQMDNVLLAPHLAGTSVGSAVNNRQQAIDQMEEAIRDGKPSALVNKSVVSKRLVRA
jgi:D-3-phosphoglycerate dehydrogenase